MESKEVESGKLGIKSKEELNKQEIKSESKSEFQFNFLIDKNAIMLVFVGLVLVISLVQAIQLNSLLDTVSSQKTQINELKLYSDNLASKDLSKVSASSGSLGGLGTDLQNLPSMVGGC